MIVSYDSKDTIFKTAVFPSSTWAGGQRHPMLTSFEIWNNFWSDTAIFMANRAHQNALEMNERLHATTPSMHLSLTICSLQKTMNMYKEYMCQLARLQKTWTTGQ